ncbi:hypothetical protein VIGAN_05178400 [Vigna angularis var. angularis]|uniref:Kinetochore protein NDC80 n=2 Tax=Phaseolus angularis TaxID=3914 RepID=A0A0S3S665_PHAAN|nr:hypothetical protein VIGAN_05178400 [Vigna angularis var. angularis]
MVTQGGVGPARASPPPPRSPPRVVSTVGIEPWLLPFALVSLCHADAASRSRPSSVGVGGRPTLDFYKDRQFQQTVVSTINSFLSSHNFPITFKTTFPSAKDILETLKFLLSLLDFPSSKLEEDLPFLLKCLNYPFKINNAINQYTVNSYMHYIRGDDDAVEEVDRNIQEKIQHQGLGEDPTENTWQLKIHHVSTQTIAS